MYFFELFNLPPQLTINKTLLRKKYFELSKKYHPDYYANTNDADQHQVLEDAALLNKAYKTLSNKDETIKYVLKEKGLLEDDEKYQLENSFLMQMLEINEELSETDFANDEIASKRLSEKLGELQNEIYAPVKNIVENYQEDITTEEELLQVKDYYFKKKYIDRLGSQSGQRL
ncbi:MAG TPA: Fe-S protein assembly co-chaperone HscB [Chitinophagaceae bacterium]|nr:Fe-S protein assembly co-chaperone HscB [Chitinophagaceae bacterium]